MAALLVIWAVIGLIGGALGALAGARSPYPRAASRWAAFARLVAPAFATILITIGGGWLMALLAGRVAATAVAPGAAAAAALLIALAPTLARRASDAHATE